MAYKYLDTPCGVLPSSWSGCAHVSLYLSTHAPGSCAPAVTLELFDSSDANVGETSLNYPTPARMTQGSLQDVEIGAQIDFDKYSVESVACW